MRNITFAILTLLAACNDERNKPAPIDYDDGGCWACPDLGEGSSTDDSPERDSGDTTCGETTT